MVIETFLSKRIYLILSLAILVLGACSSPSATEQPVAAATIVEEIVPTVPTDEIPNIATLQENIDAQFGYTYQSPDGNRYIEGVGSIQPENYIDIEVGEAIEWVVGVPRNDGTLWVTASENGRLYGYFVNIDGSYESVEILPPDSEAGKPPIIVSAQGSDTPEILAALGHSGQSLETHGIPLFNQAGSIDIDTEGNVRLFSNFEQVLNAGALRDARILQNDNGQLLFLSSPTSAYDHGVLGDAIEAESFTIVNIGEEVATFETFPVGNGQVVEGISPIWTDWNSDGKREIIVTLSDFSNGGQIALFDEQGNRLAEGPAIGLDYRWRHQIAVAPFGPSGEMELVDVLTPHIGGVVEFYQWEGDTLRIVASIPGYTSHAIGSRNLDMGAAADFDGDGIVEVVLPSQDRTHLGAIQRVAGGAEVDWRLPLDGVLSSNLSVVRLADGSLMLAAGLNDGRLRIWLP